MAPTQSPESLRVEDQEEFWKIDDLGELMRVVSSLLVFFAFLLNFLVFKTARKDRKEDRDTARDDRANDRETARQDRKADRKKEVLSFWIQETVAKPAIKSLNSYIKEEESSLNETTARIEQFIGQTVAMNLIEQELKRFTVQLDSFRRSFVTNIAVFDQRTYESLSAIIEDHENTYTIILIQLADSQDYKEEALNELNEFRINISKSLYNFQLSVLTSST